MDISQVEGKVHKPSLRFQLQVDEFNKPGRVLTTGLLTSITRSVKARLKEVPWVSI